jgi:hypothetical protein
MAKLLVSLFAAMVACPAKAEIGEAGIVSASHDYCLDRHLNFYSPRLPSHFGQTVSLPADRARALVLDPHAESVFGWAITSYLGEATELLLVTYVLQDATFGAVGRCVLLFDNLNLTALAEQIDHLLVALLVSESTLGGVAIKEYSYGLVGINWHLELMVDIIAQTSAIATTRIANTSLK